jgi:hypothetical protein
MSNLTDFNDDVAVMIESDRLKIQRHFNYPPIPIRNMDWSAVEDNYDGAEDSNCPVGHGATEVEAIKDLLEQIEDRK